MTSQITPDSARLNDLGFDNILDLMSMQSLLTIDTESGETRGLMGVSCAFDGLIETGFYLPWNHDEATLLPEQRIRLGNLLADEKRALVFHNAPYDLKVLEKVDLIKRGRKNFYDTMLMCHWVNENTMNYSLDRQSQMYGGKPKNRTKAMQYVIDTYGWDGVTYKMNKSYSSHDAWITHELFGKVKPLFDEQFPDPELWEFEQRFIWVVANMIELGIKIDVEFCVREYLKGCKAMTEERAALMFNPGSPLGLKKMLIDQMGLPVFKETPGGKPSFDKDAMKMYDMLLERTNDDRAKRILRYRGWQKTTSSNYKAYLDLRDKDNVLHPGFKIHGTETGRMSCEKPNLQQIPKSSDKEWNGKLKQAFVARDDFDLWEFDYSQLEFRLTVAYAEQHDLIEVFNDPDRDIFTEMAADMGWERKDVKTLVYLILFGGGANRAMAAFGVDYETARDLVESFHRRYPGIRKISQKASNLARVRGYVQYWTGRRRHFAKSRTTKYYRAFNSIIQGGESEIVKRAMVKLAETVCDENCRMVLQIHDAVVFEIRKGMADIYIPKIKQAMESVDYDFGVRFPVEGKRWPTKDAA